MMLLGREWSMFVVPSQGLLDLHMRPTDARRHAAATFAGAFLFASVLQRVAIQLFVLHRLVDEVFPSTVKKRLVERERRKAAKRASSLGDVVCGGRQAASAPPQLRRMQSAPRLACDTIAELFDEATVLFADIVGFTAWSSSVQPEAIFELLEALYGRYDASARLHGIFKVETIGDCYMAACGLPRRRHDHADAMASFALLMCLDFARVVEGMGVGHLSLRVGMHSGGVVGGVVNADVPRYQLFGDTARPRAPPHPSHPHPTQPDLAGEHGKPDGVHLRARPYPDVRGHRRAADGRRAARAGSSG